VSLSSIERSQTPSSQRGGGFSLLNGEERASRFYIERIECHSSLYGEEAESFSTERRECISSLCTGERVSFFYIERRQTSSLHR